MQTDHTLTNSLTAGCKKSQSLLTVALLWLCIGSTVAMALTAANTVIRNQASATFRDETGQRYNVTSNMVETLVQQVAGIELAQNQSKRTSAGGTVHFPHVLTNVGNGDDFYTLSAADISGDAFDFGSGNIKFYADTDQDGQPDNLSTPITTTPLLAADESFAFVAVADVPGTLNSGDQGQFSLTAQSDFTGTINATNTDTVGVTDQAVIDVTKAISATAGPAGSGIYTITLSYKNTSGNIATDVTLIDALPTGMIYAAGSGRWSETGNVALTDNDPLDTHTATDIELRYCAYDNSCTGIPEADQDADSDTTNQVTAIINQLPPGSRGEVSFEVSIAGGLPASLLTNIAEYKYYDGTGSVPTALTNQVTFEVTQQAGVVTNGSNSDNNDLVAEPVIVTSAAQGGTVTFTDYVWNTGNGSDSFDLTLTNHSFPQGAALQLLQADGFTPLLDTNGNGIPDTGDMDAGDVAAIIIRVQLPPGVNSGSNFEATLTATSFADNSLSNPALNRLESISNSSVDLTNNAAAGDSGALDEGTGDLSAAAVSTNSTAPGTTTRFTLYINNTSTHTDTYDLAVSTNSSFSPLALPAGWTVTFFDEQQTPLTNTGIIAAGASKLIYASVSIPADAVAGTTSLYFRALSPNTAATDSKHDAVTVALINDIMLEPDNQGQILPGGTIIYTHWLNNQGNADQTNITLSQSNNAPDWSSELYEDTDNDGVLSSGDIRISAIANLVAGERKRLFVKVYAPATAATGTANLTVLTASWNAGADTARAENLTTTNRSDVQITKEQAPDTDCNGVADVAFSYAGFDAEPGQCVMYRLTAINTGTAQMQNVRIQDATPAYTSFNNANGLPVVSQGTINPPVVDGGEGEIIGQMGVLAAGASATLIFGIEIK
jgi:uncharacterized repeat protein (TIGR01451 family)